MRPRLVLNVARPWGETDSLAVARAAQAAGLDGVGLADSPRLFPDCLLESERVLTGTDLATAGPCVLSLGLRHPATVAGALRTLARRHGGRVMAVVGRGESSVRNEGLPPPSASAYEGVLTRLGEALEAAPDPVRVLGAASGPRTIGSTSARLAGVLLDVGTSPAVVRKAVDVARDAGGEVEVWLFLRAVVTGTPGQAREAAAPVLGSCAARLAASPGWYGVSDDDLPAVRAVAEAHDYARHGTAAARRAGGAPAGAEDLVRERFVLAGGPDDVTRGVRPLSGLGVRGVVLAGALGGVLDRLPELAAAVREGLPGDG